jgi:hypothetical protein
MTNQKSLVVCLALLGAGWTLARAQATAEPSAAITVEQAVIAREIEDREPVGESTSFPAEIGQLACFTRIVGAEEETFIYHVWRHGDTERARVRLPVRSAAWRTWSTKKIDPSWTGAWTVQILDAGENVLDTLSFVVREDGEPEMGGE